jgi:hypothetical protein
LARIHHNFLSQVIARPRIQSALLRHRRRRFTDWFGGGRERSPNAARRRVISFGADVRRCWTIMANGYTFLDNAG